MLLLHSYLFLSVTSGNIQESEVNYQSNSAGWCECGAHLRDKVIWKHKKIATISWLCISYDNKCKVTVAGNCIYSPLGNFNMYDYFIEQPISYCDRVG